MTAAALAVACGLLSGLLSGMFGIGGGLVTTPAIRLLLGFPALVAVGTPLPVILPTAASGAWAYARRGMADVRAGLLMGAVGSAGSVAGALASSFVGGRVLMVATAVLVLYVAADMALHAKRGDAPATEPIPGAGEADPAEAHVGRRAVPAVVERGRTSRLAAIGLVAGAYSGLLGLGGGFVVVPALVRWLGMPLKRAIGTSLVTVAVLAVPGTVTHWALGHVDLALAGWLVIGTVPGALLGARVTAVSRERVVSVAFAIVLAAAGVWLAASEIAGALR